MLSRFGLLALTTAFVAAQPQSLKNGKTFFEVDGHGGITMKGDFTGKGAYGIAVLQGLYVESTALDGQDRKSQVGCNVNVTVTGNHMLISNLADDCTNPTVEESWNVTLGDDYVTVVATGTIHSSSTRLTRRRFSFSSISIYALFNQGVVQMYNGDSIQKNKYLSIDTLPVLYSLGKFGGDGDQAGNRSITMSRDYVTPATVVVSTSAMTELHDYFGPVVKGAKTELWFSSQDRLPLLSAPAQQYSHTFRMAANNFDFPLVGPHSLESESSDTLKDIAAILTGIYASPVGNLCTHPNEVAAGYTVGQIATTVHRPTQGYGDSYNYFDPDNYLSTFALLSSGNPYLQEQVRRVVERSGDLINSKGQLPHHFQGVSAVYQALSGATQTGPNVFWSLSALNYAKYSGNGEWLKGYMPTLRHAGMFLFDLLDTGKQMLNVPGSLMIDVFIRNEFASDSNAMVVEYFRDMADAEEMVGNHTGAQKFRDLSAQISKAVEANLWSDDHFITQLNSDGTTRDFVDYDSNFIALAHGIVNASQAQKVFKRIDNGKCPPSHTWVSEVYYNYSNCVGGNTGDSATAMGRIGWFDALARKRFGDQEHFDNVLLNPLQKDLLKTTWMHERYNCDGTQMTTRTAMYFEYPSVTCIMTHVVRYGIHLGLMTHVISPFGPTSFTYAVGNIYVQYSQHSVVLKLPGDSEKKIVIDQLTPKRHYSWQSSCGGSGDVTSDSNGTIAFTAVVGTAPDRPCTISVKRA